MTCLRETATFIIWSVGLGWRHNHLKHVVTSWNLQLSVSLDWGTECYTLSVDLHRSSKCQHEAWNGNRSVWANRHVILCVWSISFILRMALLKWLFKSSLEATLLVLEYSTGQYQCSFTWGRVAYRITICNEETTSIVINWQTLTTLNNQHIHPPSWQLSQFFQDLTAASMDKQLVTITKSLAA